jgi:cell division protein FtsN
VVDSPVFAERASGYVVQVASYRTEESAGYGWSDFSEAHRELIRGLGHEIVRAEVGGGVWYRLRMLGFESQDEANLFCDTLKTQGQDCIVVAS